MNLLWRWRQISLFIQEWQYSFVVWFGSKKVTSLFCQFRKSQNFLQLYWTWQWRERSTLYISNISRRLHPLQSCAPSSCAPLLQLQRWQGQTLEGVPPLLPGNNSRASLSTAKTLGLIQCGGGRGIKPNTAWFTTNGDWDLWKLHTGSRSGVGL